MEDVFVTRSKAESYIIFALYNGIMSARKQVIIKEIVENAHKRYLEHKENNLNNIGIPYKNGTEKILVELVCRLANEYVYKNEINEDIYESITGILAEKSQKIRDVNLLYLENFLLCSGLYELAYKVREISCQKQIRRYEKKKHVAFHDVMPLFWSYIEAGRKKDALVLSERVDRLCWSYLDKEIRFLQSVLNGKVEDHLVSNNSEEDSAFDKLIRGKRVLIVGPAENGTDVEKCVAEHDVIISMIYRRNLEINLENKSHISYYSGLALRKMDDNKEFFNDLDVAVFKRVKSDFQREMLKNGRARECHGFKEKYMGSSEEMKVALVYSNLCSPNLLQVILMDILMFHPEKVTVINTNLFLAEKRYNSKYKVAGTTQNAISFRRSFALHNMINMYQLTKLLSDNGIIEVDEGCRKVLELGTKEYTRRMQQLES